VRPREDEFRAEIQEEIRKHTTRPVAPTTAAAILILAWYMWYDGSEVWNVDA
jgi:hypothetical protein